MTLRLVLFFTVLYSPVITQTYVLDSLQPSVGHLINFEANLFKMDAFIDAWATLTFRNKEDLKNHYKTLNE